MPVCRRRECRDPPLGFSKQQKSYVNALRKAHLVVSQCAAVVRVRPAWRWAPHCGAHLVLRRSFECPGRPICRDACRCRQCEVIKRVPKMRKEKRLRCCCRWRTNGKTACAGVQVCSLQSVNSPAVSAYKCTKLRGKRRRAQHAFDGRRPRRYPLPHARCNAARPAKRRQVPRCVAPGAAGIVVPHEVDAARAAHSFLPNIHCEKEGISGPPRGARCPLSCRSGCRRSRRTPSG